MTTKKRATRKPPSAKRVIARLREELSELLNERREGHARALRDAVNAARGKRILVLEDCAGRAIATKAAVIAYECAIDRVDVAAKTLGAK